MNATPSQPIPDQRPHWRRGQFLADGRYQITEVLGEGGMGYVFRAMDWRLKIDVVVKTPHDAWVAQQPSALTLFQDEVRSLVHLSHPHVVRVLDVGEENGLPFAVMQYLDGGCLQQRLRESHARRRNPLELIQSWLPPIAKALDFIHGRHFVHLDIKPQNILFDASDFAYVSDFGLSKALLSLSRNVEDGGMVVGTPGFVAPEVTHGVAVTGQADQYSLGITLFVCVTGRMPFKETKDPMRLLVRHATEDVPNPRLFNSSLPLGIAQAILRSLDREPGKRFATCSELAIAVLDEMMPQKVGRSSIARPPSQSGQIPMFYHGEGTPQDAAVRLEPLLRAFHGAKILDITDSLLTLLIPLDSGFLRSFLRPKRGLRVQLRWFPQDESESDSPGRCTLEIRFDVHGDAPPTQLAELIPTVNEAILNLLELVAITASPTIEGIQQSTVQVATRAPLVTITRQPAEATSLPIEGKIVKCSGRALAIQSMVSVGVGEVKIDDLGNSITVSGRAVYSVPRSDGQFMVSILIDDGLTVPPSWGNTSHVNT